MARYTKVFSVVQNLVKHSKDGKSPARNDLRGPRNKFDRQVF